jgi:hypothetical protein
MANKNTKQGENLFKAVLLTHAILFFHLLIIVGLVVTVIFFRGVTQYTLWIFLGVTVLLLMSGIFLYWRIKTRAKATFHDIENSSLFRGRSFEVSFLRGLASLKFGQPGNRKAIENVASDPKFQLEDPETARIRELTELARLFEKKLITSDEYNKAKNQILKSL